jgi:tetrahydromethanopterin S-methyltransferase subunit G
VANELNPNHPAVVAARDHWHKIVALLMAQRNQKRVVITDAEIHQLIADNEGCAVTIKFDDNVGIILTLVNGEEAERLAREEGGLPV